MKVYLKIFLICVLILGWGCKKDFEEINTDPGSFTTASDGSLFNEVVASMQPGWNEQFYINNEIFYKQTQMAALTKEGWGNFTLGTEEIWSNYYSSLPEVRELEKRFATYDNSPGVNNMRAMLKIVVAMKTFKVTDLFGDIPFSQAGYGFQNLEYLRPVFDPQREIYLSLLEDLKWADENITESPITAEPFASFTGFDKLFDGNMTMWRKMANSLRLRHAVRIWDKEPELAGPVIREIIEGEKPVFTGVTGSTKPLEDAVFIPSSLGFKNESMTWSFREHKNLRMGSNIWHRLSAHDSADGSGIFDPRAYVFFETNNAKKWKPYPNNPAPTTPPEGGIPYDSHRDQTGSYDIKGESCIYSPFCYFVIADYNNMPIIFFTGAEIHFLKAEAWYRGMGVPMNSSNGNIEYLNGIIASVEWWMNTAGSSRLPLSGMAFPEMVLVPENLNAASVQEHYGFWNAHSDEEMLEFLYTQWMLDAFRQPWEVYALARRTGKTPREGAPISHFRLPYPPSEREFNGTNCAAAIASQGGDNPENKIWWVPAGR